MTKMKADPLREAWLRRLANIANSMTEAMSQGGTHKIFVDPENRDDVLAAVAALASLPAAAPDTPRTAPLSCPNCHDESDCSSIDLCNAVEEVYRGERDDDEGIDFALMQLCSVLGVDPQSVTWDAATETRDGDVQAIIGNILRAKFGEDWGPQIPMNGIERSLSETIREQMAEIVYYSFPFAATIGSPHKPEWVEGGNSFMQDRARTAASAIFALIKAKLSAPPVVTGADRAAVLKTDPELLDLIKRAKNHVMTPAEIYEQRRSFTRGMCPSNRDYKEWCAQVDRLMPPSLIVDAGKDVSAQIERG